MQAHAHILLESMEQEIISITKCGVKVNLPSSVTIIAAANPVGSFYNKAKSLPENVRITSPLLTRFDLIYPLTDQDKSSDAEFFMHISKKPRPSYNQSSAFFSQQRSVSKDKISWLKRNSTDDIEIMPADQMRFYIGYARENVVPKLSQDARGEILAFFMKLRELTLGTESQKVTYRQLEGLMRLTLARARADLAEVATKEHAVDVINIFKFTMPDIFADEDFNVAKTGELNTSRNKKSQNLSSLSKPKQQKAFLEHLQELDQTDFSSVELKDIAKELGIKDFHEIIAKLNHVGELLKTTKGYRVVE
jgi:DNA helicase MCM8